MGWGRAGAIPSVCVPAAGLVPAPACLPLLALPVQELALQTKKLMVALAECNFYGAVGIVRKALMNGDELGECLPVLSWGGLLLQPARDVQAPGRRLWLDSP